METDKIQRLNKIHTIVYKLADVVKPHDRHDFTHTVFYTTVFAWRVTPEDCTIKFVNDKWYPRAVPNTPSRFYIGSTLQPLPTDIPRYNELLSELINAHLDVDGGEFLDPYDYISKMREVLYSRPHKLAPYAIYLTPDSSVISSWRDTRTTMEEMCNWIVKECGSITFWYSVLLRKIFLSRHHDITAAKQKEMWEKLEDLPLHYEGQQWVSYNVLLGDWPHTILIENLADTILTHFPGNAVESFTAIRNLYMDHSEVEDDAIFMFNSICLPRKKSARSLV